MDVQRVARPHPRPQQAQAAKLRHGQKHVLVGSKRGAYWQPVMLPHQPGQHAAQLLRLGGALIMKHPAIRFHKRPLETLLPQFADNANLIQSEGHGQQCWINRLLFDMGRKLPRQLSPAFKPDMNGMQRNTRQNPRNSLVMTRNKGKPVGAILQIFQSLRIGPLAIGVVHALQNAPWSGDAPVSPCAMNLRIERRHARNRKIIHDPMLPCNSALSIGRCIE